MRNTKEITEVIKNAIHQDLRFVYLQINNKVFCHSVNRLCGYKANRDGE